MKNYSLFELNEYIQRVIALNFNDAIWIRAEISQIGISKGHYYIDLIEKNEQTDHIIASINAIIWQSKVTDLKYTLKRDFDQILQSGMEVLFKVKVNFHERFGIKVFIEDIDPTFTFGKLVIQKKKTIETLQKLDLIEKNGQTHLPGVIQKVAVISSPTAAGLEDYLKHLKDNAYNYHFSNQLFPTTVQGINVEKELLKSLALIESKREEFDCVVIIRGGGSKLDLLAFDGLEICKAIAHFPIPILTGIGHEIDESIADMVAHSSLRTPTAVADFIITQNAFFEATIVELGQEIVRLARDRINNDSEIINQINQFLAQKVQFTLQKEQNELLHIQQLLKIQSRNLIQQENSKLENFSKVLNLLNPNAILKRGYSITYINGKPVDSQKSLKEGDIIQTQFHDGKTDSKILKKKR